jgi:Xaa-Pro aminopeptidase
MVELGILEGDVQELIEKKTYRKYFMHGTSHWLGMDVHDVGDYVENKDSTVLKAGMVLTVEPGIYIPENDEQAPAEYRGMGIRIEDDILITQDGNDNLTKAIPKTIADIEAVVGKYV